MGRDSNKKQPEPESDPSSGHGTWTQVVTPSGKTGFASAQGLMALGAQRLCYRKDELGRWRIAGFVGAAD